MRARKARLSDAAEIDRLIRTYSGDGTLLPRSRAEISESIRDFVVVEECDRVIGCGALHFYESDLAEIRSLAVAPPFQRRGAGGRLVAVLLREAKTQAVGRVCLFTRIPDYFARWGFVPVASESLPEKMWKDCLRCPRFSCCDETAMILGGIPTHAQPPLGARVTVSILPQRLARG
jgi:amino-acid N-acetyltransferase